MLARRVVTLRSSLCLMLLGLSGCTRGCNLESAEPCEDDGDCQAPNTCHRGYCSSPGYIETDRRCRAAPSCREVGACGALTVRSFLGMNSSLECAAVDEADCRAAEICGEKGRCSVYDGFCVAQVDADCAASRRCETHDECSAASFECVRYWPACAPLGPHAHAPAWSHAQRVGVNMQRMRGPWEPGAVESAIVACEVQLTRGGGSRVRLGEHCVDGPRFERGGSVETFVQAGVRLLPGDEVAVAVQDDWEVGRESDDSFVKAIYTGVSPFQAGAGREALTCHVVPPDVARSLGAGALVVADAALAEAKSRRPDERTESGPPLEDARGAVGEAGLWLGWDDPEISTRMQQIDAIERAWGERLALVFTALRRTATPPRATFTARDEAALQVLGHVCGPELNARRGPDARQTVDGCAIELRVENLGDQALELSGDSLFGLRDIGSPRWLQVSGGLGEVLRVNVIDVRSTAPGAKPTSSLDLRAGESAIVLLGGEEKDLALGRVGPGDFTLLRGSLNYQGEYALRVELAPDPTLVAAPKQGAKSRKKK